MSKTRKVSPQVTIWDNIPHLITLPSVLDVVRDHPCSDPDASFEGMIIFMSEVDSCLYS